MVINMGLAPEHDPHFGISHDNIAKRLTRLNWKKKAIVRDSKYIWIVKGSFERNGRRIHRYFIKGIYQLNNTKFVKLNDAIQLANKCSKHVGEYPPERESGWKIHTLSWR